MTTMNQADEIKTPGFRFLLFVGLIAVGLAGNYFKFSILNADFIFGSIFAMLALQVFGLRIGIVAAAIISGYTYIAWNHPYAILTMTAEVAVVGWLINNRKINMVAADSIYWVAIGIPMGYLCFHFLSHMPTSNAMFLMTKQAINGVANCVLARLIFTAYSLRSNTPLISIRETVSNLLIFFALFTGLIMLTVGSITDFAETDHRIRTGMIQDSRGVTNGIENWLEDRQLPVENLAEMAATNPPSQMQELLEQLHQSDKNLLRISLIDKQATAIAYSPLVDELGRSTVGKSFADRPYIPELKRKLQPMLSEVIESRFGRPEPVAIMLAPVISNGDYSGYVAGILNLDRIRSLLEINSTGRDMQYTLHDRNGKVIITSRKDQETMTPFSRDKGTLNRLDEGISQWIPQLPPKTSTIELWGKSLYVVESPVGKLAEWKLILEEPVAPFQKILYDRYAVRFSMLLVVVLALLVLAEFLSRRIVSTAEQLGVITLDLPAKLASQGPVAWPESAMLETNHLILNFKEMADSLLAKFTENREINESLEQLVKERTHELKESQEKLSTAMEIARLGHWDHDVAGDLFTFNDYFYKIFRTTVEEVGGYTMSSADYARRFVHPDDIPVVIDETRKAIETSDPNFTRQLEHRIIYADGEVGHVSVRFFIVKDNLGRTVATYGVNQDITDRVKAEDSLRSEREQLLSIFESINEVIHVIDPQSYEILYANRFAEDLYGKDLKGWNCYERLNGLDSPCEHCTIDRVMESEGKPYRFEYQNPVLNKDFLATDRMIRWSDGRNVKFHIAVDITERKSAEQEKENLRSQLLHAQKMEAIGTLAGGVAHDFNNILQVALGYSELLLAGKTARDPDYDDLQKIYHAARSGADLVRNLLTFSRKVEPKPVPMDFNSQVQKVEKLLYRIIPRMIDIRLELADDLKRTNADPGQIEQIIMNLSVNARDAMGGSGSLTFRTENVTLGEEYCKLNVEAKPGDYVLLSVSDTGHGMDKETLQHIFEPFYTTKELGRGTGLGLAMVYGIVKQHRGHIGCYSEIGKGTTLKIYLPAILAEVEDVAESPEEIPSSGTETLLLVDDEDSVRGLGERILTKSGYTVLIAANGEEALALYTEKREQISLVLLDLIMPSMGGKDCLNELIKIDPAVKVLIASGYAADETTRECIKLGAKGFVAKPYRFKDLLQQVREALNER